MKITEAMLREAHHHTKLYVGNFAIGCVEKPPFKNYWIARDAKGNFKVECSSRRAAVRAVVAAENRRRTRGYP